MKSYLSAEKNKDLEGIFTKKEDLKTQLALDRSKLLHMQRNFEVFQILPEYENLEIEADEIALRLREITDDDFSDYQRLDTLHDSINSEIFSESDNLPNFIKQVEILFKESVAERLAKVQEFYKSVMNNRENYLKQEISILEQRVKSRNEEEKFLIQRQSEIFRTLKATGGLDQYNNLQKEVSRQETRIELPEKQFEKARAISLLKAECDETHGRLAYRLILNISEQQEDVLEAISLYQEISGRLYSESGQLKIGQNENGPHIDIKISAQRSKGITNM